MTEVVGFTRAGCATAARIAAGLDDARAWAPARLSQATGLPGFLDIASWTCERLAQGARQLVFVGAAGIAVRALAPHVASKLTDPALVCVDEAGRWAIPLLSGHVGGANDLARRVARILGATPVITTATDVRGVFSIDAWAARMGLTIANPQAIKRVSAALLEGGCVAVVPGAQVRVAGPLPAGLVLEERGAPTGDGREAAESVRRVPRVLIGPKVCGPEGQDGADDLRLLTHNVVVGAGCRRGCAPEALRAAVDAALEQAGLAPEAVCALATIDLKADEAAMLALAHERGWRLMAFGARELAAQEGAFASSEFVRAHVGVDNVCERALSCAGAVRVLDKTARDGTTVALGCTAVTLQFDDLEDDLG